MSRALLIGYRLLFAACTVLFVWLVPRCMATGHPLAAAWDAGCALLSGVMTVWALCSKPRPVS